MAMPLQTAEQSATQGRSSAERDALASLGPNSCAAPKRASQPWKLLGTG